jgi:crotonobetainyl-CoA:carnitine CoA-transferase CaiB-like acyl-CoA transferase
MFRGMTRDELVATCERARMPFGPVGRPEDLFKDPHLRQSGQLVDTILLNGSTISIPTLPLGMETWSPPSTTELAQPGAHTREILAAAGLSADEIEAVAPAKN